MGLIWFLQGMQERRGKWQFLPKEKMSQFCEESYPEDSKRAKRKISGNIYKANLGLETLIPLSLLS